MISYSVNTKLKTDKYRAVVYALSYNNPLHDISSISTTLREMIASPGYVLFDLLLSNGANFNRFVEGFFNGKTVVFDSLNVVELRDFHQIECINSYYRNNPTILNNSVLSPSEKMRFGKQTFSG